jgi:hypothetical protein
MRRLNIADKISELGVDMPALDTFHKMGDITALRHDADTGFYRSNYERGPLPYAIVAAHRPKVVLEFGTGRGYGSLCMARAFVDHDIDGQIYTVDSRTYTEKHPWPLDTGTGARIESLSWADVWPEHFPQEWLDRLQLQNGLSTDIMDNWRSSGLPYPDLAFIDGGHDYLTVQFDYYSTLRVANPSLRILFDDYAGKPGFGVQKLVDEEVSHHFTAEILLPGDNTLLSNGGYNVVPTEGMIFLDSDEADNPWQNDIQSNEIQSKLDHCRRQMLRQKRIAAVKNFVRPLANRMGYRRATGS